MSQLQVAVASDRLPWLEDEPAPPAPSGRRRDLLLWALLALTLTAAAAYWLGSEGWKARNAGRVSSWSGTTIPLPDAQPTEPQPQVPIAPAPEVAPLPAPTVSVPPVAKTASREPARPAPRRKPRPEAKPKQTNIANMAAEQVANALSDKPQTTAKPAAPSPPAAKPKRLKPWSAWESMGASGRVVQIGAFGSRQQAKRGWKRMTRAYPAVGRLQAVVVTSRNSRGRTFYRFQIGTTSQAHSEVLCQRMERIQYSCAVVGLPWKAKVER
jgi:outer membrane biosynthesis protein TonB